LDTGASIRDILEGSAAAARVAKNIASSSILAACSMLTVLGMTTGEAYTGSNCLLKQHLSILTSYANIYNIF